MFDKFKRTPSDFTHFSLTCLCYIETENKRRTDLRGYRKPTNFQDGMLLNIVISR